MFQFPGFALKPLFYSGLNTPIDDLYPQRDLAITLRVQIVGSGFPHSDIHGSKPVRSSPWLNAAYHVLHRLPTPRHPLIALKTLELLSLSLPPRRGNDDGKTRFLRMIPRPCAHRRQRCDPEGSSTTTMHGGIIPSSQCSDIQNQAHCARALNRSLSG